MATIRAGNQPFLLVVDVQVGVMDEAWDAPRVIQNVAGCGSSAPAEQGVPVLWIQHADQNLAYGSPGVAMGAGVAAGGRQGTQSTSSSTRHSRKPRWKKNLPGSGQPTSCRRHGDQLVRSATAYGTHSDHGYDLTRTT